MVRFFLKMKKFLLLIIFLSFLSTSDISACSCQLTKKELLLQQIEILKQEIFVYQSLISNLNRNNDISAPSYLIFDIKNEKIINKKNSSSKYPVASITKLMTAVIATENIEKNDNIEITSEMLKPYGHSPAIFLGANITAENLLKATMIQSTNDAAESLSFFTGKENFINLMNKKAEDLEMNDTVFYDVHGLNPKNKSTAKDILKLLLYINREHPEILEISRENNFWLPGSDGKMLKFRNVNNFYPLSYFVGGKTGYLPEAKQTFAGIFSVDNTYIATIIFYSDNRQADIFTALKKVKNN